MQRPVVVVLSRGGKRIARAVRDHAMSGSGRKSGSRRQSSAPKPAHILAGAHLLRWPGTLLSLARLVATRAGLHSRRQRGSAQSGRGTVHGEKGLSPGQPAALQAERKVTGPPSPHYETTAAGNPILLCEIRRRLVSDHQPRSGRVKPRRIIPPVLVRRFVPPAPRTCSRSQHQAISACDAAHCVPCPQSWRSG